MLQHIMNEVKAKYLIEDTFKIEGRGIVFAGKILIGTINNGDLIKFDFFGEKIVRKIKGIDGIRTTETKPNLGILIECNDESELEKLQNWNPKQTTALIFQSVENKKQSKKFNIKHNNTIHGVIQMIFSVYWLWDFGKLMYYYQYTDMVFLFMYPNWTMLIFILMSIIGVLISCFVIFKRMKIKKGYLLIIGLFIIGLIINLLVI